MIFVSIFWLFVAVFMFGLGNSVGKSVDRGGTGFYILGVVPSVFTLICMFAPEDSVVSLVLTILAVILMVVFIIAGISGSFEQKSKQEEEAEKKRVEERKHKEMQNEIIQFAKSNGVDLTDNYERRNMYLNQAISRVFVGSLEVQKPTYTRGVVEGSLADNISILANAQKQANYEEQLRSRANYLDSASNPKDRYWEEAYEIITILEKMPNSEKYVDYEKDILSKNQTELELMIMRAQIHNVR